MFLSSKTIILIRQVVSSCVLLSNVLLHHVLLFKRKSFFDCFAALTFSRVSSVGSWNCHWACQLRKSSRVQNWTDWQFTVGLIPFVLMHKHSHTIEKIVNEVNLCTALQHIIQSFIDSEPSKIYAWRLTRSKHRSSTSQMICHAHKHIRLFLLLHKIRY